MNVSIEKLSIKKTHPSAMLPKAATRGSAGLDLYSIDDAVLMPKSCSIIHTGVAVQIPDGYFGAIFPRSGLSTNHGIRLSNCVAVIDSDYRGSVIIPLYNDSDKIYRVHKGDRVAQLVVIPFLKCEPIEVEEIDETERGENGIGSSGR